MIGKVIYSHMMPVQEVFRNDFIYLSEYLYDPMFRIFNFERIPLIVMDKKPITEFRYIGGEKVDLIGNMMDVINPMSGIRGWVLESWIYDPRLQSKTT